MDGATTDRSPLTEEQLDVKLPKLNGDYAVGPTERTEKEYAPSTSERPAIPSGYSTTFSAAHINRIEHLKHMCSWLVSAATGGRRFTELSHVTSSTPAGPSSRASQPPMMRLGSTQPLARKGASSSRIIGNDKRKSNSYRLISMPATTPTSSGTTHLQPEKPRRQQHLLSAEMRSIDEGGATADVMEAGRSEEEDEEQEDEDEEEEAEEVVATAVGSGVGLWASRGMLLAAAMLYGTNFGCVKLLEETVPMSLAAVLRFTVSVTPFLPFLLKTNLGVFRAGVEIGLFDAIGFWAQSKSLTTTPASKAAFICSLSVILVPLMDVALGARNGEGSKNPKAEPAAKKHQAVVFATLNGPWFPALLAVAGVACLEFIGGKSRPSTGDAWALVQPLCFSVVFWLTERSSRKYPGDTFGIVAAHLLTVAVLAIGWCAQAGQIPVSFAILRETVIPASGSLAVPFALIWTGLVTTALTVFLETLAMAKVSAAESAVIFATEPIWGATFAVVLLGETIGWNTGVGAMLIVLACTWSTVGPGIQSKMLSLVTATGAAGTSAGGVNANNDDLIDTVATASHREVRQSLYLV